MTHTAYTVSDWLGYLTHAEIDLLKSLTKGLPDNPVVLNIGAGGGTSGLTFMETRPDLFLYTIDIQYESDPLGCIEGEITVLRDAGLLDYGRYQPICGDSRQVGLNWGSTHKAKFDLIFIDDGHEYAECKGDIEIWLPWIKKSGFIAVHDYYKRECYAHRHPEKVITPWLLQYVIKEYPGVDRAVDELLLDKYRKIAQTDTLIVFRNEVVKN